VPPVPRLLAVRAAVIVLPSILAGGLITGCSGFDKTFGQREAIVTFQQGTPRSIRMAVRAACSHVNQATPEPLPTDNKLSDYVNDVRYRIDKASDAELAQLETCLNKFPSVRGVETPQDANS
jgi:predicted Zn-dependent protease